jgi:hypothetical protein
MPISSDTSGISGLEMMAMRLKILYPNVAVGGPTKRITVRPNAKRIYIMEKS